MILAPLTFEDVLYVAERMRPWDKKEIYATRWNEDPAELARQCCATGDFGWVAGIERPIAAVGAVPVHPNVWSVWCFATDEFPRIALSLTRYVKKAMIPALVESGAHRAACASIEGHTDAQKWLELLGARRECTHRALGKNGEDFHVYVWTR